MSSEQADIAERHVLTGIHLYRAGKKAHALIHIRKALALNPDSGLGHVWLAVMLQSGGSSRDVVPHLHAAARFLPAHAPEQDVCTWLLNRSGATQSSNEEVSGKICFRTVHNHTHHRSGWSYASQALAPLHNPNGVLFEPFLESPFVWEQQYPNQNVTYLWRALHDAGLENVPAASESRMPPFRQQWVGFLHNPPDVPAWLHGDHRPQAIFATAMWQESMSCCKGIFTLSETVAVWMRRQLDVPVSALVHPTEIPETLFDWNAFVDNDRRQIVQVGWWLRELNAIFRLPVPNGYQKTCLVPRFSADPQGHLARFRAQEQAAMGWETIARDDVTELSHLSNEAYDRLLSENVIFLKLHAASANNAIIECIARGTPVLVNRLPAVEEYLGSDYPLFYVDLEDARRKAEDFGRIHAAHQHLISCTTRDKLSGDNFRESFVASDVYQQL
ncbi:tetratricopeptide repeat protein [Pseudomonadota bacterium]